MAFKYNGIFLRHTGLQEQMKQTMADLNEGATHNYEQNRSSLSCFSFVWHLLLTSAQERGRKVKETETSAPATKKGKVKKKKGEWEWSETRSKLVHVIDQLVHLDLCRLIPSSAERDCLINVVTKSICYVLEDADSLKDDGLKSSLLDLLAVIVKQYENGSVHGKYT